jgi:hypothetical protein
MTNINPEPIVSASATRGDALNDATGYGVTIIPVTGLKPGDLYYRVLKVHHLTPLENNGNHHVFMDVLGLNGQRNNGVKVSIGWPTGASTATVDKPANEPGTNAPLTGGQVVTVRVIGTSSEQVAGLHTQHPDEPPVTAWGHNGNSVGHHSFLIVWQLDVWGTETPPVEPPVTPPTWPLLMLPYSTVITRQCYDPDGRWTQVIEITLKSAAVTPGE